MREQQTSWRQPPWAFQCWLKRELKCLADRRNQTINEVRRAREKVHDLDAAGEARNRVLTDTMQAAVERLQETMANLDHQWRRQIMLDSYGIFVYDEQGPNAGKSVKLDGEARGYIDRLAQSYRQGRGRVIDSYGPPPPGTEPPATPSSPFLP